MATSKYKGIKTESGVPMEVHDDLTVEEGLRISVNGKPLTVTMRTPGNDLELVHGLLFSEDIYTDTETRLEAILDSENKQGTVTGLNLHIDEEKLGSGYLNGRNFLSVASCGICGKTDLDQPTSNAHELGDLEISTELVEQMFSSMNSSQQTFKQSGGSHAAAAFNQKGEQLSIMEDIGRHNAVDKVIGDLILKKSLSEAKTLTVSGRISYEIVVKAFRARIPLLAAVSAPSSLAVDFAKELGITLLAFCRGDKLTCYSHPQRLLSTINYQSSTQKNVKKSK